MDEFFYNSLCSYYHSLSVSGYRRQDDVDKLLILLFYYHLLYQDFRGYITKDDYRDIELALNCLYGSSCLISYPEFEKMGALHIGHISELAQRVQVIENTDVLKVSNEGVNGDVSDSDVIVISEE